MRIAYYRVRSDDPSIEAQRDAMGGDFDREYRDEGVSDGIVAARRPGFARLLDDVRNGDSVHVFAIDRLGRDTIDVRSTVRRLVMAGVTVEVHGIGPIAGATAAPVLGTLAQLAALEHRRIARRAAAAREAARTALTPAGASRKASLGRPMATDAATVLAWRSETGASIPETARHFGLKVTTVKRYGRLMADAVELAGLG
ncbi:Resolvase [Beijerinckiaceae bacterium RH AL1]|nr:Resolvase [Beijerinckiaceae bacterium RH AL8]VVB43773.1 Resolvase [Beijerinckiaceae bacterium RH CH11]VVC53996.1 Resolvase [Beijerinckiaceae bacterium RH AL1]